MELRQLRYFLAVADGQNVRQAAERLNVSAPALSVAIRQLEQEIGVELFIRERRRLRLTEAGRVLQEQTRGNLERLKQSVVLAQQTASGDVGHLTIGFVQGAVFLVLSRVIPQFRALYPRVSLTWRHLSIGGLLDAISRGEVDLGFGSPPFPEGMEFTPLVETRFLVAIPANHPLAEKQKISIRDLDREPFLQVSSIQNSELRREIEQMFYDEGCTINVVYDLDNAFSMIGFVAMGIGCGLVPDYACNFQHPGVTFRPLAGAGFAKTVAIVQKSGRGGAVQMFHQLAVDVCQ